MSFKGKVIYNPSGKAGEYSYWAANFYNGCSAKCEYCYNRKGITAKVLGGDKPVLKKSLIDEKRALYIFCDELWKNIDEIRKHGLFFNFVSDPCLLQTYPLNFEAWNYCFLQKVPMKILTEQTWWVSDFINSWHDNSLFAIGFTLTGHDELEPGAATNQERIEAMKKLHNAGFKTWASIEPIIDIDSSDEMIKQIRGYCDLYKIGLQSGDKLYKDDFGKHCLRMAIDSWSYYLHDAKIYFKDSLLKQAGIKREDLLSHCVTRDLIYENSKP